MHKSVFTFGVLLSSLVMLAIIPLFNQNNFPNVKAQEYGAYDYDDNYMYSEYPTETNKYECRTGPFEGFFVSLVEFCKFNKFDKDDRDRDENRTITQGPPGPAGVVGPQGERGLTGATGLTGMTGPAGEDGMDGAQGPRGFNGTDGVNGTQGPAGPRGFNGTDGVNGTQGPAGPRGFNGTDGLPGPAGPNEINSSKIYPVTGTPASFEGVTRIPITSTAMCNPGDIVLEGGFSISTDPGADIDLTSLSSGPTNNGQDYFITAAGNEIVIQSNALCFDNP